MSGKLSPADKAAAAAGGKLSAKQASDAEIAKLDVATLDAALKAKSANPSSVEFRAGNALNTARDTGYAAALVDVYACRPDAAGLGSAQEALDAWAAAIGALLPQPPA